MSGHYKLIILVKLSVYKNSDYNTKCPVHWNCDTHIDTTLQYVNMVVSCINNYQKQTVPMFSTSFRNSFHMWKRDKLS